MGCECDFFASIDRLITLARTDFAYPTTAETTGLRLACRVASVGATNQEIQQLHYSVPAEMQRLWRNCREAVLFVDVDYDQWGLEILAPWTAGKVTQEMRTERPRDILETDLIFGLFRGDSDFVVLRSDPDASDFGKVTVGLPLDARDDWHWTGLCLSGFLEKFFEARGQKFWELASQF